MDSNFRFLSKREISKLSIEELCKYYKEVRKYKLNNTEEIKGIQLKQKSHPLLLSLITLKRLLSGQKIHIVNGRIEKLDKPVIFAVSHIGKFDIEIVSEAIKQHYYLLSGDEEYMHRTLDGLFLELNGVIYVDTEDKEDRLVAKETVIKTLNKGGNVMWFPEGIWNLSPNLIILPCYYGIIEAALRTDAVIIPISVEQNNKEFYVNIGKKFLIDEYREKFDNDKDIQITAIKDLRDKLATLKWEIWEQLPIATRESIDSEYYNRFVENRINEWPYFTIETINNRIFKDKNIVDQEEVFGPVKKLRPNHNNAFLMRKL